MTVQAFTVDYSTDGTTWVALSNVQEITAQVGRSGLTDQFEPSRANIVCRYPTGYATPNSALIVGTWIRFQRIGGLYEMWRGRIRNVTVTWGKPYAANVGNADFVSIECEGVMAEWGRQSGYDEVIAADNILDQFTYISGLFDLPVGTTYTAATAQELAQSTITDSVLTWANTAVNSVGATLKDGSGQLGLYTKDFVGTLPVSFSDVANNATNQVFDELQFDSLAQDYFTLVEINRNTGSTVFALEGLGPYRTLRLSTFNASDAQAQDLADYYIGIYGTATFGISSISATAEAQNTFALDLGYGWWDLPGYRCNLTFRGTTYYLTILGCQFTATPNGARFTYNVINADLTPYFYLNDTLNGILDTNKLSW